jgi:hypothetical protein
MAKATIKQPAGILRVVRFSPYRKGVGPVFRLVTWDTGKMRGGKCMLGYRFSIGRSVNVVNNPAVGDVLFEGEDFGCSPLHAIDSDQAVASLMTFMTLRPGDTDREYFDDYTPEQLAYCSEHAEALSAAVHDKYGNL